MIVQLYNYSYISSYCFFSFSFYLLSCLFISSPKIDGPSARGSRHCRVQGGSNVHGPCTHMQRGCFFFSFFQAYDLQATMEQPCPLFISSPLLYLSYVSKSFSLMIISYYYSSVHFFLFLLLKRISILSHLNPLRSNKFLSNSHPIL